MSHPLAANGTDSPSLLNSLRRFRFQKKGSQDSSDGLEMSEKQSLETTVAGCSPKSPAKCDTDVLIVPETPESALRKEAKDGSTGWESPLQGSSCTTDMELDASPVMHNGVKRKRAISSGSDDNVEPAANVEPSSVTSPVVIDDDDDYEESLDEYTKYMTNKEKCLKQLMDHFKDADVMNLQDALVACKWDVDQALLHLENNPPNRKMNSPHRNARFKTVPAPKGKGVAFDAAEDREVIPQVKLRATVVTKPGEPSKKGGGNADKFKEFNNIQSRSAVSQVDRKKKKKKVLKIADDSEDEDYRNENIYDSADDSEDNVEERETPALAESRRIVAEFFDNATFNELLTIPGCSRKKAEAILENRPYESWKELVDKFETRKHLATSLLNGAKNVLHTRGVVSRLMSRCQSISDQMEEIVSRLVRGESQDSEGYIKTQPSILNDSLSLSPYQLIGLNWLAVMHKQGLNGILADEMGLGKTIQAIAFLAYLHEQGESSPHLVIVPTSTLENWMREFKLWCPSLDVLVYHGSQEDRRELKYQILDGEVGRFHVLITTYHMVSGSAEDRSLFKKLGFNYVIFDEAHMLKNMASQRYINLMKVNAQRKILLTGTPLQNNLVELMSLLTFVMPNMFGKKTDQIKFMFSSAAKTEENQSQFERDRVAHAKKIMRPFVLRRLKRDVLQQLPSKHEEENFCTMTPYQASCYVNLVAALSKQFKDNDEGHSSSGMMMKLRRASNHPLLLRHHYDMEKLAVMAQLMLKEPSHSDANPDIILEDMEVMSDFELHTLCNKYKVLHDYRLEDDQILDSGKFKELDVLLRDIVSRKNRVLIFSQFTMMLDILESYLNIRGHKWLRLDGSTAVTDRQDLIDQYNGDSSILAFLLSTRAGGLGINLTSANVVILHDLDFNPYNDKQAEDRCHRLGQNRDVHVIKLISKNTIEEGILSIAKDKLKLEKDITEDTSKEDVDSVSVANLLKSALGS